MAAESPLLLLSDDLLDDAADVPAEEADVEAAATGPPMGLAAYTLPFTLLQQFPPPGVADAIIVLAAFVCAAVVVVALGKHSAESKNFLPISLVPPPPCD